jgi:hypothetical protein
MNLENNIKDVISKKMQDGTVEKLVGEAVEEAVSKALEGLTGYGGEIKTTIEKNLKSVIVPFLDGYDYSKYIIKLDAAMTEILKECSKDNKTILENFKSFTSKKIEEINVSDIFEKYIKYVEDNVDVSDLEVEFDDDVSYEAVNVSFEIEEEEGRSWTSYITAKLFLECNEDEEMNFEVELIKDRNSNYWEARYKRIEMTDIKSLRYMNEFEVFLIKLSQDDTKIYADTYSDNDSVIPSEKPEASY